MADDGVTTELNKLSRWQRAAFAAGCAERVAPLVIHLAQPGAAPLFQSELERLYELIAHDSADGEEDSAVAEVESFLDENPTDDSHLPLFYVSEALGVLAYALEAAQAADAQSAVWASTAARDIAGEVDNVLLDDWRTPVVIDPRNPPPPGALETRETEAQRESLRLLKSARWPDAELLDSLRRLSQEASRELDRSVPEFSRRMGWSR